MESFEDLFQTWCIINDEKLDDANVVIIFESLKGETITFTLDDRKIELCLVPGCIIIDSNSTSELIQDLISEESQWLSEREEINLNSIMDHILASYLRLKNKDDVEMASGEEEDDDDEDAFFGEDHVEEDDYKKIIE